MIQIDYDDFVEWMPEVIAGLWWLRNPTTRLRRKSAWLWRQTEKLSEALRCPCHVRTEFSTHTEFARWSYYCLYVLCDWQMIGESYSKYFDNWDTGYVWHRLWQHGGLTSLAVRLFTRFPTRKSGYNLHIKVFSIGLFMKKSHTAVCDDPMHALQKSLWHTRPCVVCAGRMYHQLHPNVPQEHRDYT